MHWYICRSSHRKCSVRKGVLRNFAKFTGKQGLQHYQSKKETLAQVFASEFCEISKNTFFTEHLWTTASAYATFERSPRWNEFVDKFSQELSVS